MIRVLFLLFIASFALRAHALELPKAENGFLHVQTWDFSTQKIPLEGTWLYFDDQLISPKKIDFSSATYTSFPALWNDFRDSKSGTGFATYALTIVRSRNDKPLALDIPQIYCNYKLWINGRVVAKNGVVGRSEKESQPQWLPQTVKIESTNDTLRLVLQISNFHHHNGGAREPIYLGAFSQLDQFRAWTIGGTLTESITLFLIAIAFVIVFARSRKKVVMYFSLLCLTWSIRNVFSNQYIFISFFPDFNWELMVKIEYLTLYLTMVWAILFLGRLFKTESSKIMKYFLVGGNLLFVVITLATNAITYTRWLPAYLALSFMVIAFGLIIVVLALLNDRAGILPVVVAVIMGLVIFGYDLLSYEGLFTYNPVILSIGYILIFLLLTLALVHHLKIGASSSSSELYYDDLYGDTKS